MLLSFHIDSNNLELKRLLEHVSHEFLEFPFETHKTQKMITICYFYHLFYLHLHQGLTNEHA